MNREYARRGEYRGRGSDQGDERSRRQNWRDRDSGYSNQNQGYERGNSDQIVSQDVARPSLQSRLTMDNRVDASGSSAAPLRQPENDNNLAFNNPFVQFSPSEDANRAPQQNESNQLFPLEYIYQTRRDNFVNVSRNKQRHNPLPSPRTIAPTAEEHNLCLLELMQKKEKEMSKKFKDFENSIQFDAKQRAKDKALSEELYEVVRERHSRPLAEVYRYYNEDRSKFVKYSDSLVHFEEFQAFFMSHQHLFNVLNIDGIKTRGFGYRRGMVWLLGIILSRENENPNGAKVKNLVRQLSTLPTYDPKGPWIDSHFWETPLSGPEELLGFFQKFENHLFTITVQDPELPVETAFVKVTEAAKKVPSLWDSTLLSTVTKLNPRDVYYDLTQTTTHKAVITVSQEAYGQAVISEGLYRGRLVSITHSDIPLSMMDIRNGFSAMYPPGAPVVVKVFVTLMAKNHFACMDIQNYRPYWRKEMTTFRNYGHRNKQEICNLKLEERKNATAKFDARKNYELFIVPKLEDLVGEEGISLEKVANLIAHGELKYFKDTYQFELEMKSHPHLFRFNGGKYVKVDIMKRAAYANYLLFFSNKQNNGKWLSVEEIIATLADRKCNLKEFATVGKIRELHSCLKYWIRCHTNPDNEKYEAYEKKRFEFVGIYDGIAVVPVTVEERLEMRRMRWKEIRVADKHRNDLSSKGDEEEDGDSLSSLSDSDSAAEHSLPSLPSSDLDSSNE